MRIILVVFAMLLPTSAFAQDTSTFPDYTQEQRWARASQLGMVAMAAAVRHAKDMGQSIDEFGVWWGDLFDDSWGEPGSYSPVQVLRGMRRNWLSFYGGEVEIIAASDQAAGGRFNRAPLTRAFGDDGVLYGVTLEEFDRINTLFYEAIANYHGLAFEERREGDDTVLTFRQR